MTATLRIPSLSFEHKFPDDATALAKADRIRASHPGLDVLVDISPSRPEAPSDCCLTGETPPGGADELDIPTFLREAAIARAKRRGAICVAALDRDRAGHSMPLFSSMETAE
ncbi:MAG: hypothetical protein IT537_08480 [Hyphomicrobiales bacterium]|nr:hypothetical protein [Hyphomicrobiales bacterium]